MGLFNTVAEENIRLTRENRSLRLQNEALERQVKCLSEVAAYECSRADILRDVVGRILSAFRAVLTKEHNVSI